MSVLTSEQDLTNAGETLRLRYRQQGKAMEESLSMVRSADRPFRHMQEARRVLGATALKGSIDSSFDVEHVLLHRPIEHAFGLLHSRCGTWYWLVPNLVAVTEIWCCKAEFAV